MSQPIATHLHDGVKGTWSRSSVTLTLAILLAAVGGTCVAAQQIATKPTSLAELKQQRKEAASRKRRVIFNNDGDDVKFTGPAYNGRSGVAFGAANSPNLGEAYWESVKVHSRARSLNDLVLSVGASK